MKVQRWSHQLLHPPILAASQILNKPGIWTKDKSQLLKHHHRSQRKLSTNQFTVWKRGKKKKLWISQTQHIKIPTGITRAEHSKADTVSYTLWRWSGELWSRCAQSWAQSFAFVYQVLLFAATSETHHPRPPHCAGFKQSQHTITHKHCLYSCITFVPILDKITKITENTLHMHTGNQVRPCYQKYIFGE